MAKVKGKEQLCSSGDYKSYFKSIQGLEGHTLFERYPAIENIVNKYIDRKYVYFLAQPVIDGEIINWFSKPYVDTPQQFSALQDEKKAKYQQIKVDTLAHYNSVITSLKVDGKNKEAESLENAIKFVDDRFVYCYDDIVVLGIWGMQLRDERKEPMGTAMKTQFLKKEREPRVIEDSIPVVNPEPEVVPPLIPHIDPQPVVNPFTVRFNSGERGNIIGTSEYTKYNDEIITEAEIPKVEAKAGYEFIGWDNNPNNHIVYDHREFTAQYRKIPWYKRLWRWLVAFFTGILIWRWLRWLFLILLLVLLFCLLLHKCVGCDGCGGGRPRALPYPITDKPWIGEDPRAGQGGIYNPGQPYDPVPTPPGYSDVLPPDQGVLPPVDTSKIVRDPGNPSIVGNRLNVLMENEDKSIMDLAKDFKSKYPDAKYKVVYYDNVIKRMQIEVPQEEREQLKQEIPAKLAPNYKLFVFDEALFEEGYTPNDPAFSDPQKSWYLKAINAPQAWDITRGLRKHTIAIVDNGFSLNHPELQSKVVMPYNVWLHSKEIFPQKVDHGTHVAGTALAIMDNKEGICGIAPECAFMPIQVANKQGIMTTTSVLDGVLYALYQGADVINISLGQQLKGTLSDAKQRDLQDNHFKEEERLWNEIMRISIKHKATIVIAAGNENMLAGINPMNRPKNFIVVSAVNKNNQQYSKAGFSNYGNYSTISAPGVDIYSTIGNNSYATMEGTSMASPIVTGSIALMKSINENLTTEQIVCVLQKTGIAVDNKIGNLIQLDKAIQYVKAGNFSDCASQKPDTGDVQVLLSWNNYNDLDLACIDPDGNTVWYKNKNVPSGGLLQIDMNVNPNDSRTPIENIYWKHGTAPNGTYQVYLWLFKQHEDDIDETPYKITVKYGDSTKVLAGKIKKADGPIPIFKFTLGNASDTLNNKADALKQSRNRLKQQIDSIDLLLKDIKNNKTLEK